MPGSNPSATEIDIAFRLFGPAERRMPRHLVRAGA